MKYPTDTGLNPAVAKALVESGRQALARGDKRFSIRKALETIRSTLKVSINNNAQARYTDALIKSVPGIEGLIERRSTLRGKNKPATVSDEVTRIGRILAAGTRLKYLVVEGPDGGEYQVAFPPKVGE